ncbi:MAG: glycosyltransferase [Acidimicrobiia bacterium]
MSTFPPTPCGVATFSAALTGGLVASGAKVGVVRVGDGPATADPRVVADWPAGAAGSAADAACTLNGFDVAVVQHEYGLYAGPDGEEIVDLVRGLDVPSIVVAHTVLAEPTAHQRAVLEAVADAAGAVVVMTDAGRQRLSDVFEVDASKVLVIPHGAAVPPGPTAAHPRHLGGRPLLLTWGLLGPGKGIEVAIEAMALLASTKPRPRYLVAGSTHPKVFAADGDAYREMLMRKTWENGAAASVSFDDGYRSLAALGELIAAAAVVVLPYDSRDQVTSGVLVDAVAAGRPVVSTAFPHAVELLASGAGIVVPQRDPMALASALEQVLTEPGLADEMAAEARRLAPGLAWPAVASQYLGLGERLLSGLEAVTA